MWVTKLLISPVKIRIFCPKTTKFGPKLALLVILMPCWWVGWWLWRAGCISQNTFLLYQYCLWFLEICIRKTFLDLNILSHRLQGRVTPSKWLASMCSFILVDGPSFPQGLQILARFCRFPSWIMLSLVSTIVLTVSSCSRESADIIEVLGRASALLPVLLSCVTLSWKSFTRFSAELFGHFRIKEAWSE